MSKTEEFRYKYVIRVLHSFFYFSVLLLTLALYFKIYMTQK